MGVKVFGQGTQGCQYSGYGNGMSQVVPISDHGDGDPLCWCGSFPLYDQRGNYFGFFPRKGKIIVNKISWVSCFMVVFSCIFSRKGYQGNIIIKWRQYFDLRYGC